MAFRFRRFSTSFSNKFSSRGDTIVEVLVSIAVISTVLAGAFGVVQKSTHAVRDSQERSEVLQLLQGQVELVRSEAIQATSADDPIFVTSPKYFCMDQASNTRKDSPTLTKDTFDDASKYASECKGLGPGNLYNIAVSYDDSTDVFTFQGHWDRVDGGQDQVQLVYRIRPGSVLPPSEPSGDGDGGIINGCVVHPETCHNVGTYIWDGSYVNFAQERPGMTIKSCYWTFTNPEAPDDIVSNQKCQPGDELPHAWPKFPVKPYPEDCTTYWTDISITATYSDGITKTFKYYSKHPEGAFHMPDCSSNTY